MSSLRQIPAQFFGRIVARFRAWQQRRRPAVAIPATSFFQFASGSPIHREVTSSGVRVYSLCGDCGAQLNASATLCDECARKRSRPAHPR